MKPLRFLNGQMSDYAAVWRGYDAATLLMVSTVLMVSIFCFLYGLGSYPLRDINEGLYAEIAREMLASGNYVVPHLNGVPYIEKPPLMYWLMALSFQLSGPSSASARLVSALPMLSVAIGLIWFCRRLGHLRTGLFAALILSTSAPVIMLSRTVLFDALLTALISACLLVFFQWYLSRRRVWLLLSAVLLALATLEKGAVAIAIVGGIIGLFLLLMRDRSTLRALFDPLAIGIFFTVAVPWHIAATIQQDGFAWFYLVNEHLLRFIGLRQPQDYQSGPAYYYLPRLLLMMFPWTPFFALLIMRSKAPQIDFKSRAMRRFCLAWILFPMLFFSLSQAKAQYYILVIAPAVALLIAHELDRRLQVGAGRSVAWCTAMSTALAVAILFVGLHPDRQEWLSDKGPWLITGLFVLSCAAGFVALRLFRMTGNYTLLRDATVLLPAFLTVPLLIMILRLADSQSGTKSSRAVADVIARHGGSSMVVFVYRDFEDVFSSLPFYLRRRVKVIDSVSRDLQFGCKATDMRNPSPGGNACVSIEEFKSTVAQQPVAVVVHKDRLEAFWKATNHDFARIESVNGKWIFFNR